LSQYPALVTTIAKSFFFKSAVNQRQSDVTNYIVTNQVNVWISELVWVGGGGANLHIHRTAYTKGGTGVELHFSYFAALNHFFQRKKMSFWQFGG